MNFPLSIETTDTTGMSESDIERAEKVFGLIITPHFSRDVVEVLTHMLKQIEIVHD